MYVTSGAAIRGPAELRDLFGDEGLGRFAGKPDRRWITSGLRNTRSEALLTTLKIEEWGFGEFLAAFQRAFGQSYLQSEVDACKVAIAWFTGGQVSCPAKVRQLGVACRSDRRDDRERE